MAPKAKFDSNDPTILAAINVFTSIGLTRTKATEALRNPRNTASLKELIDRNKLTTKGLEEKQGNLILQIAIQGTKLEADERDYIVKSVVEGRLKTSDQVAGMVGTPISQACCKSNALY